MTSLEVLEIYGISTNDIEEVKPFYLSNCPNEEYNNTPLVSFKPRETYKLVILKNKTVLVERPKDNSEILDVYNRPTYIFNNLKKIEPISVISQLTPNALKSSLVSFIEELELIALTCSDSESKERLLNLIREKAWIIKN